jgi:hypothetical protein
MTHVVSGREDEGKSLEQVLAEINETLKRATEGLESFSRELFSASVSTGYDFETIAKTASEFARQGLSADEAVRHTRDALILARLVGVDAKFAVSARDFAEGIARAGATASDAAVSFDDLIVLIAAAQQTTARSGAVIGNALKTVFERIQREDTLRSLRLVGIQTAAEDGKPLSTMTLLRAIANAKLTPVQERELQEIIGGVFQLNILRAIFKGLKDNKED